RGPNIISKTPKPTEKEDRDIYKHHHNKRITIIMPCIYMSAWIDEKNTLRVPLQWWQRKQAL
ncbi:hypothetical protein ABTA76_20085, partial [Acinetobacter baumannii]